jgi:hypothetical protein
MIVLTIKKSSCDVSGDGGCRCDGSSGGRYGGRGGGVGEECCW